MAGGRRTVKVLKARICKMAAKLPRVRRFRSFGGNSAEMVATAVIPSVAYGVPTMGIAPTMLNALRSSIARALSPDTAGRNVDTTYIALEALGRRVDLAHATVAATVHTYACACWDGAL